MADGGRRDGGPGRDRGRTGPLRGAVAVVTGASRGIGKGIAVELGTAGATVYVTGRTTAAGGVLPGTISETAAAVDEAGGRGVAVRCDHHDDNQVAQLFDRIRQEQGRLNVLVNNVYSSPDLVPWLNKPFWELPPDAWDQVVGIGARSHYVAAALGVPLMLGHEPSLVVNVSSSGAVQYAHNVLYGVGKAAVDKLSADMAHELAPRGVTVVSLWPGLVRTELTMMGAVRTDDGREVLRLPGEGEFDLGQAETPRFCGRAVVAMASDADVGGRTGRAWPVAELARAYGFTDVDGRIPEVLMRPAEEKAAPR
ncbi:MAG TPA: SDR family NAD(P)-dependent oxidoreductase [Acidimicrobiales bacterium]|nr:SDR family NAD(P)-dependent oxidoreductase [Acidimicrobiales bacterium]